MCIQLFIIASAPIHLTLIVEIKRLERTLRSKRGVSTCLDHHLLDLDLTQIMTEVSGSSHMPPVHDCRRGSKHVRFSIFA